MSVYADYILPPTTLLNKRCGYCHNNLDETLAASSQDPKWKLVAHSDGGHLHPIHFTCAKTLHDAGHHHCLTCKRWLDPDALYSGVEKYVQRIIRLTQYNLVRQHLPVLTVGVVAFSVFGRFWEQLSDESREASLAMGGLIGIFGTAGYGALSSRTALQFVQGITLVMSLGLRLQNSVFQNLEQQALQALGKGIIFTLMAVNNDSALGELAGWVSFAALPLFASFSGASETSVLQTGVIVTTVLTMLSFFGTLLKVLPLDEGIPLRHNSTPFRI